MNRFALAAFATAALVGCTPDATPPVRAADHAANAASRGGVVGNTTSDADTPEQAAWRGRIAGTRAGVERILMEEVSKRGLPSLAFGVVFHGRLVYAIGFGEVRGRPVGEDTVYRIGSITKTFTGAALLALRDAGKIGLDDPVSKYIPEMSGVIAPTPDSAPITVRHLVTHTSGFSRLAGLDYADGHEVTEAEIVARLRGQRLDFAPGSQARYSNFAMALAGIVVARASGERYRDYVTHHLLEPLGMRSTVWDESAVPPDRLAPASREGDHGFAPASPHWRLGAAESMGGLYSSVADLARYMAFQLSAWPPRATPDPGPIRRSTLRESHLVAGFSRAGKEGFGINWVIKDEPEVGFTLFHNGGTEGYRSSLWMLPDRQIGVVLLGPSFEAIDAVARRALAPIVWEVQPRVTMGAPARAAFERVRAQLDKPTPARFEAEFAPSFLKAIPPDKLLAFFERVAEKIGRCSPHEHVTRADTPGTAELELTCEKGTASVKLDVQLDAPHLINGLRINTR